MTLPLSSANLTSQQAAAATVASKTAATRATAKVDSESGSLTHVAASTKVTISAAGQLAAAANQEAMETPAQTAQEAQGNDMQAKRLLAKEQAAAKVAKG